MKPRLAITLGDPSGIGPEIVAKALRNPHVRSFCTPIVIGRRPPGIRYGRPSRQAGRSAIESLQQALDLLTSGQADALVTAPASKESFALAGLGFPGHTEWLAAQARVKDAAMLMVAGNLRAVLMTRHVPITRVASRLRASVIVSSAWQAFEFAQRCLRRAKPRLVLCGLNPHAGDNGLIGREETTEFKKALQWLKRRGCPVQGPRPADTVFREMADGAYDITLAAYHDQGMIPLKLYAPERLVNITLGLPYIRTSPGHGTAYDIAGRHRADAGPMIEAIRLAALYSQKQRLA